MPSTDLDITKLHTKRIQTIVGPVKQFNSSTGAREKYVLNFDDGYQAEYCPHVGKKDPKVAYPNEITFRIVHRGQHGDEIEPALLNGPATEKSSRSVTNLHTHPAVISLNASIRFAEIRKNDRATLDEIFADAETIMEWLDKQMSIESL